MNEGERLRDARLSAMSDRALLELVLDDHGEEVTIAERAAFAEMLSAVKGGYYLTERQRAWALDAGARVTPIDAKDVPAGRPVEVPAVLRNLPLKPPGRK